MLDSSEEITPPWNVPNWTIPYFAITKSNLVFTMTQLSEQDFIFINEQDKSLIAYDPELIESKKSALDKESDIFTKAQEALKIRCEAITDLNLSPSILEDYIREYIYCQMAIGLNTRALKLYRKYVLQDQHANIGTGRQHWVPECYMKSFLQSGNFRRIEFNKKSLNEFKSPSMYNNPPLYLGPIPITDKKAGKNANMSDPSFVEVKEKRGQFYEPWFELVISSFERNFSHLEKTSNPVSNLWEFIVLSTFFLLLDLRTKEQSISPLGWDWETKEGYLIDYFPKIISMMELIPYDTEIFTNDLRLPFTAHPVLVEQEKEWVFSAWAIYTPTCYLWFRNRESRTPKEEGEMRSWLNVIKILTQNNTEQALYHQVNSNWWTIDRWT